MAGSQAATWITVVLLAPLLWGAGLLVLALAGRFFPSLGAALDRLFERLEASEIPR